MEYGYGTKGERWGGRIPDGHNSGDWGLPPGTEVRMCVRLQAAVAKPTKIVVVAFFL